MLDPSDISRVRPMQVAARVRFIVEGQEQTGIEHLRHQCVKLLFLARAPMDAVWLGQVRNKVYPVLEFRKAGHGGYLA
jgi:hypothetical protein